MRGQADHSAITFKNQTYIPLYIYIHIYIFSYRYEKLRLLKLIAIYTTFVIRKELKLRNFIKATWTEITQIIETLIQVYAFLKCHGLTKKIFCRDFSLSCFNLMLSDTVTPTQLKVHSDQ